MFEDELSDMLDLYDEHERERITRLCYELLDNLLNLTQSESKDVKQAAFMAVALMSDSLKEKFAKVPPSPHRGFLPFFHPPPHPLARVVCGRVSCSVVMRLCRREQYYERFAPACLEILRRKQPVAGRNKELAGRALECLTQMAVSGMLPVCGGACVVRLRHAHS